MSKSIDIYGRTIGECSVRNVNLNKAMIASGHAVLYRQNKKYTTEQLSARLSKKGVWQGRFIEPWIWRKNKKMSLDCK